MVTRSPRIGVGPGFDSQGSVTLFLKFCFPNLHWIHGNTIEVKDCEFVPVSTKKSKYLYLGKQEWILQLGLVKHTERQFSLCCSSERIRMPCHQQVTHSAALKAKTACQEGTSDIRIIAAAKCNFKLIFLQIFSHSRLPALHTLTTPIWNLPFRLSEFSGGFTVCKKITTWGKRHKAGP